MRWMRTPLGSRSAPVMSTRYRTFCCGIPGGLPEGWLARAGGGGVELTADALDAGRERLVGGGGGGDEGGQERGVHLGDGLVRGDDRLGERAGGGCLCLLRGSDDDLGLGGR